MSVEEPNQNSNTCERSASKDYRLYISTGLQYRETPKRKKKKKLQNNPRTKSLNDNYTWYYKTFAMVLQWRPTISTAFCNKAYQTSGNTEAFFHWACKVGSRSIDGVLQKTVSCMQIFYNQMWKLSESCLAQLLVCCPSVLVGRLFIIILNFISAFVGITVRCKRRERRHSLQNEFAATAQACWRSFS